MILCVYFLSEYFLSVNKFGIIFVSHARTCFIKENRWLAINDEVNYE